MKFILTIILFICCCTLSNGQDNNDALIDGDDKTSVFTFNTNYPIPKRAGFYSALVPGLGQVYNKQYWKLGIVAGGLAAAGYFIQTNGRKYRIYRNAYITRIDNNDNTNDNVIDVDTNFIDTRIYSTADLNTLQNQHRQYLEYSVVFTTLGYALNVLDAYISANLKTFDINDDISFHARPSFENRQPGLALVFKLK